MALAFVDAGSGYAGSGTSLTYAFNNSATTNYLVVGVIDYGSFVTSVTYAGVSMTQLHSRGIAGGGGTLRIYGLSSPASGSNNVVVTKSSANNLIASVVGSYSGASSTQPNATGDNASTSGTSLAVTVTSTVSGAWAIMVGWNDNGATVAAGTNTTKRVENGTYGGLGLFDRNQATTPAGAETLTFTRANGQFTGVAIMLQEPPSGYTMTADVGTFTLTGVAANLLAALKLTADVGSYVLTGISAGLNKGFSMIADVGSYILTGFDAGLMAARKLTADVGTFVLTGIAANLVRGYMLAASVGSFILSFTGLGGWIGMQKNSSTWSKGSKNNSTWTNTNKNS